MKKHLIAAAVAGALAVPAMAQVTVSGRIDTAVVNTSVDGDSATAVDDNLLTSNQVVLSGSEDLGGGMKAGFIVSSGFGSDVNGNLNFGDRGAAMTLSGGFGAFEIGKTPGTMLNSTMASGVTGNLGNLGTYQARPDNMVGYTTPSMSGITARVVYAVGDETIANAGDGAQTEISVQYNVAPVLVRVAQATYKDDALTDKELGAQVNVDLGAALINVRYQKTDLVDDLGDLSRYGVGAAVPFGDGLTGALDYLKFEDGPSQVSATVVKALSKRTNAYGAYAKGSDGGARILAVGVRHSF